MSNLYIKATQGNMKVKPVYKGHSMEHIKATQENMKVKSVYKGHSREHESQTCI